MAKKKAPSPSKNRVVSEPKSAMSYRLSREKIARAQHVLGAPTATATIEEALDLVVFRRELVTGAQSVAGMEIDDVFPAGTPRRR